MLSRSLCSLSTKIIRKWFREEWSFPLKEAFPLRPGDDLKDRCPRRIGIVLTSSDGAMGGPQNRRVKSHSLTDSFKLLIDIS